LTGINGIDEIILGLSIFLGSSEKESASADSLRKGGDRVMCTVILLNYNEFQPLMQEMGKGQKGSGEGYEVGISGKMLRVRRGGFTAS